MIVCECVTVALSSILFSLLCVFLNSVVGCVQLEELQDYLSDVLHVRRPERVEMSQTISWSVIFVHFLHL